MNNPLNKRLLHIDGLRAIAVLLVVLGHVVDSNNGPAVLGALRHAGNVGVRIFFVISGFVITRILINEVTATGSVSIRNFYERRARRILPALIFFLAVTGLLGYFEWITVDGKDFFRSIFFVMNYHHSEPRVWTLNHLWSLSAEEQFYLVWPLIIGVTAIDKAFSRTILLITLTIPIRAFMHFAFDASGSAMTREIQAIVDSMACGGLLAMMLDKQYFTSKFKPHSLNGNLLLTASLSFVTISIATFFVSKPFYYIIGQSFTNFGITFFVAYLVIFPESQVSKFLSLSPFVYIGTISYSLYLWQQVFLHHSTKLWLFSFPQNLIFLFICSLLSYHFIERYFLRSKK